MSEPSPETTRPATVADVIARLENQYGALDFLPLNPEILTVALAAYLQDLGIAADNNDALEMLVDEDNPVLPAEFLSLFAVATIEGGQISDDLAREVAALLNADELFEPHVIAPVPLVTLLISMLTSGARVAYMNELPVTASELIDAANELSLSLAVQAPRFDSGVLSRRNAEFTQISSVFIVFNEDEYNRINAGMTSLTELLELSPLTVPEEYDVEANMEAAVGLQQEFVNFILTEEDESAEGSTLTDEDMERFLNGDFDSESTDTPVQEEGAGFGLHPIDTSARVVMSAATSDPDLLSTIPDDLDEVAVIAIQIEGHPAVETAWDMMKSAKQVGHSGGISPDFIAGNPTHPTILLHVWADREGVDTSTDSPHHPPCIIVPLCIACHAETCALIEDTGWAVLTPQNSEGGIAIAFNPHVFMQMELEAFRIAAESLMD